MLQSRPIGVRDPHGCTCENEILHSHQRRIRCRRIVRLGNARAAIRHSKLAAACRKMHSFLLGQYRQRTRSSEAPVNDCPGANHLRAFG